MQEVHGNVVGGGHFGRDKTLAKLAERYYWVGMSADVRYFCRTCDQCQRANRYKICVLKANDEFGNVFYILENLTNTQQSYILFLCYQRFGTQLG